MIVPILSGRNCCVPRDRDVTTLKKAEATLTALCFFVQTLLSLLSLSVSHREMKVCDRKMQLQVKEKERGT